MLPIFPNEPFAPPIVFILLPTYPCLSPIRLHLQKRFHETVTMTLPNTVIEDHLLLT